MKGSKPFVEKNGGGGGFWKDGSIPMKLGDLKKSKLGHWGKKSSRHEKEATRVEVYSNGGGNLKGDWMDHNGRQWVLKTKQGMKRYWVLLCAPKSPGGKML